jgi:hypothetical protein
MSDVYYWLASAAIPAILFIASSVVYGARKLRRKLYTVSAEEQTTIINEELCLRQTAQQQQQQQQADGQKRGATMPRNYIKNIDNNKHSNMAPDVGITRRSVTKRDALLEKLTLPELFKNNNSLIYASNGIPGTYNNNNKHVGLNVTEQDIYQIKENLRKTQTVNNKDAVDASPKDSPNNDHSPTLFLESLKDRYASLGLNNRKKAPGRRMKKVTFDETSCKRPATARALGFNCLTRDACSCALTLYFYTGSRSG